MSLGVTELDSEKKLQWEAGGRKKWPVFTSESVKRPGAKA